jgi:hypothetical protein
MYEETVAFGQPAREVLLPLQARLKAAQRPPARCGKGGRSSTRAIGQAADESGEILQPHARRAEIPKHERGLVKMPQAASQAQPVVAEDYARDIGLVRCQKPSQAPSPHEKSLSCSSRHATRACRLRLWVAHLLLRGLPVPGSDHLVVASAALGRSATQNAPCQNTPTEETTK